MKGERKGRESETQMRGKRTACSSLSPGAIRKCAVEAGWAWDAEGAMDAHVAVATVGGEEEGSGEPKAWGERLREEDPSGDTPLCVPPGDWLCFARGKGGGGKNVRRV